MSESNAGDVALHTSVVADRLCGGQTPLTLSLAEQIAVHVGDRILDGRYTPGERLIEQNLAAEFGISRGPAREALRILEREGLVRIHPRRGASVTALSEKEVRDIFEVRAALLRIVTERQAATRSPETIARMERGVAELERYAADPNAGAAYAETTFRLGLGAVREVGNERLSDIVMSLALQTLRYTKLGLATQQRRRESIAMWRAALVALRNGDVERAGDLAVERIERSRDEVLRQMREKRMPNVA